MSEKLSYGSFVGAISQGRVVWDPNVELKFTVAL
jgi:hypothetical protein